VSTNRAAPLYYVPSAAEEPGWSIDQANMQGADWLMQQSGQKLVLVNLVQEYQQNRMSSRTQGAVVAKPSTLWKANWQRGPVLAPWPTRDTLSALVDDLHGRATAVCVIEWGTEPLPAAWLRARRAVNVVDGSEYPGADEPLLDPVVEAAMTELGQSVNHGNVFSGTDKARAVHTLQKLYQAGYRWDVDHMCGWALANGFTGAEEDRLREYATKVLRRSPFSPQPTDPYSPGAIERWQDQASQPPA
jgi:hypothetical protein